MRRLNSIDQAIVLASVVDLYDRGYDAPAIAAFFELSADEVEALLVSALHHAAAARR